MANNLEDQKKVKYKGLGGDTDETSTACLYNPGEILRCKAPDIYNRKKQVWKSAKIEIIYQNSPTSPQGVESNWKDMGVIICGIIEPDRP